MGIHIFPVHSANTADMYTERYDSMCNFYLDAGCMDCSKCHGLDCPLKGPPLLVSDTPAVVSRAVASLPKNLHLRSIDGRRQVVAKKTIAYRTMFGPLDAPEGDCDRGETTFFLKVSKEFQFLLLF